MITFVEFNLYFLNESWRWMQDEELLYLINAVQVTIEKQSLWFQHLQNREDYEIYGVMYDKIPIGVCGLKHITKYDGEYFGYIGEKEYWGKGIGKDLVGHIEDIARKKGLKSIYLNVRHDNHRALRLYEKMHYQMVSRIENIIKMKKIL